MIAAILPEPVAAADTFGDAGQDSLYPQERELVAKAVERRRREFATVRALARAALGTLGLPPVPLIPDRRGAPRWPAGVVGSMTHCDGYRAAALARSAQIAAIGIDAEPNGPLPDGVLDVVALPGERRWISELSAASPRVHWDRLLFSAKESVFKAWYPRTRCELDFHQAEITVEPGAADGPGAPSGVFRVGLRLPAGAPEAGWLTGTAGRWLVEDGLVVTALTVPVPAAGGAAAVP